ncbi:MAG TPA: hypothetical protein VM432_08865 [Bdellovibrionales bacterium]|nr:hypothetical protein [Bdellovibrionales bacterium]
MNPRENDIVAGSDNSIYAEEDGGYAGPRDPNLQPHPRQEGGAIIRNNEDFEREMNQKTKKPEEKQNDAAPEDLADRPLNVTPQGP